MKPLILIAPFCLLISSCKSGKNNLSTQEKFTLTSAQFSENAKIPDSLSCVAGANMRTPLLHWENLPKGTVELALIADDTDAIPVAGHIWDHWIVYRIGTGVDKMGAGFMPSNSLQGKNSSGKNEYQGPCPPPGQLHHYTFRLFALKENIGIDTVGATSATLRNAMKGKIIDSTVLTGLFQQ